jgi:DNA-binding PadR family transcriptional regulator
MARGMKWPSIQELEVLRVLQGAARDMYGLEVVESGVIGRSSVYIVLGRLEEKGFLTVTRPKSARHPGLPRPLYRINGEGARALAAAEMLGIGSVSRRS